MSDSIGALLDPWWLAVLAVIGVLGIVTAIVSLFFSLGRRPGRLFAHHPPTLADGDEFLLALTGAINSPIRGGGRAEVLSNGDHFFPAMLEAIRGAERSVTFFTYIFDDGKAGKEFLRALTERASAGVEVRLLLDGFGAMGVDQEDLDALERAGGKYHYYRPLRFGKLTRFHRRNHRRAIVIDGRVGFTGGASIGDKWLGDAQSPEHWRDDMFRVTGPLALSLQAAFGEAWSNTHGEILAGPDFYPRDGAGDTDRTRDDVHISRHINLISSPSDEAHSVRKLFWLSFMAAQQRLYLTHAYFVPDAHMRAALVDRARAGVDVRIVTANHHTDAKPVWYAGRRHYEQLLEAGVRIWEFQPTFVHSKNLVADGKWSVVGSANMSIRSKELNEENVLGILDPDFGAELERTFFADLENAREIRLEEWRRRGFGTRLLERFCALFEEQY